MNLASRLGCGWRDRTMNFGRAVAVHPRAGRSVAMRRYGRILTIVLACLWAAPDAKSDVQIAGLTDLSLGTWSGIGDLTGDIGHCVLNTLTPAKFSIVASGDGAGGAFALINGASSLPIQVSYSDGGGFTAMTANTALTSQKAQNQVKFDKCVAGTGSQLQIRVLILEADMSAASSGNHSGTIYLIVSPI